MMIKDSLTRNGYALCFRHGRSVIVLAEHLEEGVPKLLFPKFVEALKAEPRPAKRSRLIT